MSLIKSISGIRGTIGGNPGEALTPVDIVKFVSAYCVRLKKLYPGRKCRVVVGRDARLSGEMVEELVCGTLAACGTDAGAILLLQEAWMFRWLWEVNPRFCGITWEE